MPLLFVALLGGSVLSPEERAIAFLVREVPAWSRTNKCFSCHNNGNAARALFAATRRGYTVPDAALAETIRWLSHPAAWEHNGSNPAFDDKHLASLQFALALLDAVDGGRVRTRTPLIDAAALVAPAQLRDGSWAVGPDGTVGSPTTLGAALATAEARRLLARADTERYGAAVRRADAWLRRLPVQTVLNAAAVLLALEKSEDDAAVSQRKVCLSVIRKGESKEGGWGPYVNSSPEVFDTALVVVALRQQLDSAEIRNWLRRGRTYLVRTQQKDGCWQETTRPAGEISYAERLSTTAYATRALLATR
jgi:hypothetical protein